MRYWQVEEKKLTKPSKSHRNSRFSSKFHPKIKKINFSLTVENFSNSKNFVLGLLPFKPNSEVDVARDMLVNWIVILSKTDNLDREKISSGIHQIRELFESEEFKSTPGRSPKNSDTKVPLPTQQIFESVFYPAKAKLDFHLNLITITKTLVEKLQMLMRGGVRDDQAYIQAVFNTHIRDELKKNLANKIFGYLH